MAALNPTAQETTSPFHCWIKSKDWSTFKNGKYAGETLPAVVLFPCEFLQRDCCKINRDEGPWLYVNTTQPVQEPEVVFINTSYKGNLWYDEDPKRPGPLTPNSLSHYVENHGNAGGHVKYITSVLPKSPFDLPNKGIINGCPFKVLKIPEDRSGPAVGDILPKGFKKPSNPAKKYHVWIVSSCIKDETQTYPLLESNYGNESIRPLRGNDVLTTVGDKLDWLYGNRKPKDPRMAYHERAQKRFAASPFPRFTLAHNRHYRNV